MWTKSYTWPFWTTVFLIGLRWSYEWWFYPALRPNTSIIDLSIYADIKSILELIFIPWLWVVSIYYLRLNRFPGDVFKTIIGLAILPVIAILITLLFINTAFYENFLEGFFAFCALMYFVGLFVAYI